MTLMPHSRQRAIRLVSLSILGALDTAYFSHLLINGTARGGLTCRLPLAFYVYNSLHHRRVVRYGVAIGSPARRLCVGDGGFYRSRVAIAPTVR